MSNVIAFRPRPVPPPSNVIRFRLPEHRLNDLYPPERHGDGWAVPEERMSGLGFLYHRFTTEQAANHFFETGEM